MQICARCAEQNPDGSRFCSACGAELAGPEGREVRKTVTVLFCDVTGSTALGESTDPEALRGLLARYFERMRDIVEAHGGTVEKFIGDAVMAVFGVPLVHEDDALRACRAAVEMRDALPELGVQARIGVNSGEVVTGTRERLATGDAVNVAARLEQAARPGEILLGEHTRRLTPDAIEVEALDPIEAKGKAEPLRAHRLVRVVEGVGAIQRRLDAPLIGRQAELAQVRDAFGRAVGARHCGLVTVVGPPGIGKSRFAREAAAILREDADVLTGRCLPYGDGITYWPLVEVFREARAEEQLAAALAAPSPEEIFWAVRKALEARARARPLTLVLDDIHWAEPTLLDLLEHVLDWTRDAPILLLCLARPELLDERPAWRARAGAVTLTLEPLADRETDELIEELLSGGALGEPTRARIREVAEGNPLFVEQLIALLSEEGHLDDVPPTINALLAARLDGLSEGERDLLERASVIGHDFEWEALGELAVDRRRPSGTLLAALVRKELIRPHELLVDTFRFRHGLIRDAAYDRLPKALRADLHERFAGWLEGRGDEFAEIVGYHLEQAFRALSDLGPPDERARGLAERAAERLAAAGMRAVGRGDTHAAANLLGRAAALMPPDAPRRLALLPVLGSVLEEAGRWDEADRALSEAVERARAAGEEAVALDAGLSLQRLRLHTVDAGVGQRPVWELLERAIPFYTATGDEARLARALTVAGMLRFWRGEAGAAITDLERAARAARTAGERAHEIESVQYVLMSMLKGPTPVSEALSRADELERETEPSPSLRVHLLRVRAHLHAMEGRFELARELVAEAKALAEELGLEVTLARMAVQSGQIELLAADRVRAEHELRPAVDALADMGDWGHLCSVLPHLVDALLVEGRADDLLPLVERTARYTAPEDVDGQVSLRRVRAQILARRGQVEEAERVLREAIERGERSDYLELRANCHVALADVLRRTGRTEEARASLDEAVQLLEQKGNLAGVAQLRGVPVESLLEPDRSS